MRSFIFRLIVVSASVISAWGLAVAQEDPSVDTKTQDVARLLELMQVKSLAAQIQDQMVAAMQESGMTMDTAIWNIISDYGATLIDSMFLDFVDVYANNFTHEEILTYIDFYQSPAGAKLLATQPRLIEQTMAIASKWQQKMLPRMYEELERLDQEQLRNDQH
ncbi:DUF2059 domain-containing protein [bacterium]|nr:DUF2059 domain-containing protein [bacterium]